MSAHITFGSRVSIASAHDIEEWSERFGCTEDELVEAVRIIGTCPAEVELFLKVERRE